MNNEFAERLLAIEQQMQGLQAELQAANARSMIGSDAVPYRIGEVVNAPTEGDNTFLVRFVDGQFNDSVGINTPTYTPRQASGKYYVHNLGNGLPVQNTKIPVWQWSGKYWTMVGSSNNGSTPPSAPDTAIVKVDQTAGITTSGIWQAGPGCVWPGRKLTNRIDDAEYELDYCTDTAEINRWTTSTHIWITELPVAIKQGVMASGLPVNIPMVARRVRDSFTVGSESRELWAITPALNQFYLIYIGPFGNTELVLPDANGIYTATILTDFAVNNVRTDPIVSRVDGLPATMTSAALAVEVKGRRPVRAGFYLAYERWAVSEYDYLTRPMLLFESCDLNVSKSFSSYGVTLASTGLQVMEFVVESDGEYVGFTYSGASDWFAATLSGTFRFSLTVSCRGAASTVQNVQIGFRKSTNGGSTWSTPLRYSYMRSGNEGTIDGSGTAHLEQIFDLNAGDLIQVTMQNMTGTRQVTIQSAILVVDRQYVKADGTF